MPVPLECQGLDQREFPCDATARSRFRICSVNSLSILTSARISRMDFSPTCLLRPFAADRALPSGVVGPVECSHGLFLNAAWRSLSRPSGVSGPRIFRLRRPAATRLGFGGEYACWIMT